MSLLFLAKGTAYLGSARTDEHGNVISTSEPRFEPDPDGGSVAVGVLDPNTMEPTGPASLFGDWDAAGYLSRVMALLQPSRAVNIPDFRAILHAAKADGNEDVFCQYCSGLNCRDCIVREWKADEKGE